MRRTLPYRGITATWLTWRGYAATNTSCGSDKQCTVVLDGRTGGQLLKVPASRRSSCRDRDRG